MKVFAWHGYCVDERHTRSYGPLTRVGFNLYRCRCGKTMQPERWWHRAMGRFNPFRRPLKGGPF